MSTIAHDGSGRITSIAQPGGMYAVQGLSYDNTTTHRLTGLTDALGAVRAFTYDGRGWVRTVTVSGAGGVLAVTDTVSAVPTVVLPAAGRGVSVATADPGVVPDSAWTTIASAGGVASRVRADRFGLPLVREVREASGRVQRATWVRDANGLPLASKDPENLITTFTYKPGTPLVETDDHNNEIAYYTYGSYDQPLTVVQNNALVAQYYYSGAALAPDSVRAQGATTKLTWDATGRNLTTTAPNAQVTQRTYQTTGLLNASTVVAPGGFGTTFGYDAGGRLTSVRDPLGHKDSTMFDALNRGTRLESPAGVTVASYNDAARTATLTDALAQTYLSKFDHLGRDTAQVDPRGKHDNQYFDAKGNDTAVVTRAGQVIRFGYDALGRVVSRTDPAGVTKFAYDPASNYGGAPANGWVADSSAATIDTTWFNSEGLPSLAHSRRGSTRYDLRWAYDVDLVGLRQLTWGDSVTPTRGTQTLGFDAQFRLNGLIPTATSAGSSVTYTSAGLVASVKLPTAASSANWLSLAPVLTARQQLASLSYSYSALQSALGRQYAYDADGRRAAIYQGPADNLVVRSLAYDAAGRLVAYGDSSHVRTWEFVCYVYDWDTNCISWGYEPVVAHTGLRGGTYAYDAVGNRTDHSATIGTGNRLSAFDGYSLAYDETGNLVHKMMAIFYRIRGLMTIVGHIPHHEPE